MYIKKKTNFFIPWRMFSQCFFVPRFEFCERNVMSSFKNAGTLSVKYSCKLSNNRLRFSGRDFPERLIIALSYTAVVPDWFSRGSSLTVWCKPIRCQEIKNTRIPWIWLVRFHLFLYLEKIPSDQRETVRRLT